MRIIGTGRAHPAKVVTNAMLEQFLDTSDEWIKERTGMSERRVITSEKLEDLAADAARRAIEDAGIEPTDIDYIICSNVVNEYVTPGLSCIIQGKVGAKCACVDVNAACSGFIYALDMADDRIRSGKAKNILVVAAEEPTRMVDWNDRSTCVLFGDGAGALIFERSSSSYSGIIDTVVMSDGAGYDILHGTNDHKIEMNGPETYKRAVLSMPHAARYIMDHAGITADNVDWIIPHQANLRIIESCAARLDFPLDKILVTVDKHANTSGASGVLALAYGFESGKIKHGQLILYPAFGSGLTWGAALIRV